MKTKLEQWSEFHNGKSKSLKLLKPVFKELRKIHEKYIAVENKDNDLSECSFWYGERSHIGFLAAAVWEKDGTALEEYSTDKKTKTRRGRGDLWIRIKSFCAACEAKHLRLNLKNKDGKESTGKVYAELKKAEIAVGEKTTNYENKPLAVDLDFPVFRIGVVIDC